MAEVVIYTKKVCPYCVAAKNLFHAKGVAYKEISVEGNEATYAELKQKTGHMTVPQIFINDKFMGGYSDISKLDDEGQLDALLK